MPQPQVHVQAWAPNVLRLRLYPTDGPSPDPAMTGYLLPKSAVELAEIPSMWLHTARPCLPLNISATGASDSRSVGAGGGAREMRPEVATPSTGDKSALRVASGNIEAAVTASGGLRISRLSDNATLLLYDNPITVGTTYPDGTAAINATLAVGNRGPAETLRFFGGGCRCGGGYRVQDHAGGGAMVNPGDPSHGRADLHFGVPIGMAKGPTTGGLGSQCGMMNGMPWVLARDRDGISFGLFDNTLGLTYGTASATTASMSLIASRTTHIDLLVVTWPAGSPSAGSARSSAILGSYADALGHVLEMPIEVVGYWHSKDSIASQEVLADLLLYSLLCCLPNSPSQAPCRLP